MRALVLIMTSVLLPAIAAATEAPANTPAPAAPAAAPMTAPVVTGTVARAQFTSAIQDKEPTDNLTSLTNDKTQLYFYTELKNFSGAKVTHRWEYQGKVMAEQAFDVGSTRWRVWSSKTFDPLWTGEWKVSVVDASGATVAVQTLTYAAPQPAAAAPTAQPAAAPATQKY